MGDPKVCEAVMGPSRVHWLTGFMEKLTEPGARLLMLGPRRAGKTTLLKNLHRLLPPSRFETSIHLLEAFDTVPNALEQLAVYCLAPKHKHRHRIVLIDDVECFSGSDLTAIRRHIRLHPGISFVLTTSTVAGLQESLTAQCNVMQLAMPRDEDLRCLGGTGCTPAFGMSIGCALGQNKACDLIGQKLRWRVRCEAPDIKAAVGTGDATVALQEVDRLLMDGWSCGDLIESLHVALIQGEWPRELESRIASTLLRYSTLADRPDLVDALLYIMVIDLASNA